jgi:hypothetical protein
MGIEFTITDDGKIAMNKPAFHDVDQAVANAEQAFERGQAALLTSTGQAKFGPEEQAARTAALVASATEAISQAIAGVEAIRDQALADANAVEYGDPAALLTADELTTAATRRPFVEADLRTLPPAQLAGRLEAVVTHGDRAERWLYWRACSALMTEFAAPPSSPLSAGRHMDVRNERDERRSLLRQAASQLAALVDPDRAERAKSARALADEASRRRLQLIRKRQEVDGTAARQRAEGMRRTMATF